MKRLLVDTNVLIEIWRSGYEGWEIIEFSSNHVCTVTYIEFLQGSKSRQRTKAEVFLSGFQHIKIDPVVCDSAIDLIRRHSEKDGLRLADALIAATCLEHDLTLLTTNRRHFEPVNGLKLI